jgi:hypothetical protein
MDGHQIRDFGGSIGFSGNSKSSPLGYFLSLEACRRGTTTYSQISENHFNINLALSYSDYLLGKEVLLKDGLIFLVLFLILKAEQFQLYNSPILSFQFFNSSKRCFSTSVINC